MTDKDTYIISNIIEKKNYIHFLKQKKDNENITKCQFQLIKKSFESKYRKKNDYPIITENILDQYIQYCLKKYKNNNFYFTRLQILLNNFTTFKISNHIILNIIKQKKNISDSILSVKKKETITDICDKENNIFIYIYRSYIRLYEKIYKTEYKTNKNIKILFITYDIENISKDYIKQLQKLFDISLKNIDIFDKNQIKQNQIEENTYDIVLLNTDFDCFIYLNDLFNKINQICKENGTFIVLGYDIFTEEDQFIKLCMNKIKKKQDIQLSYPINLFELEYMLSKFQFILFYSNEFIKIYGDLHNYMQTYYSLFINRKI